MKYLRHPGDKFWHVLSEGDEPLCGQKLSEAVLLAAETLFCDDELCYLTVCEKCSKASEEVS